MKRTLLVFTVVILACYVGRAQEKVDTRSDTSGLAQMITLSNWLIEYEETALYLTEDKEEFKKTPINRAGQSGFTFRDEENNWHTVFGKISAGEFIPSIHRILLQDGKICEGSLVQDPDLSGYAFALQSCYANFKVVSDTTGVHFNQFVRKNEDGDFEVFFLPAFQPSGQAIYGCEWKGTFNPKLREVKDIHTYFNGIKGIWIGQPRVLWLNYRDCTTITLGGVYFIEYFHSFFNTINLDTQSITLSKTQEGKWSLKSKKQ